VRVIVFSEISVANWYQQLTQIAGKADAARKFLIKAHRQKQTVLRHF
jgi:hypothetical protein